MSIRIRAFGQLAMLQTALSGQSQRHIATQMGYLLTPFTRGNSRWNCRNLVVSFPVTYCFVTKFHDLVLF